MVKLRNQLEKLETGESSRAHSLRNKVVGAGVASLALLSAIYGRAELKSEAQYRAKTKREHAVTIAKIKDDGFGAKKVYWVNEDEALLELDLGNCKIDMVSASVSRSTDNSITEISDYEVEGYALPTIKEGYRPSGPAGNRKYTYIDGIPTILEFDSLPDLKQNILGIEPCKTLAGNFVDGRNSSDAGS